MEDTPNGTQDPVCGDTGLRGLLIRAALLLGLLLGAAAPVCAQQEEPRAAPDSRPQEADSRPQEGAREQGPGRQEEEPGDQEKEPKDGELQALIEKDLEQLLTMEVVTSVSRKEQQVNRVAAAVSVLSSEDLRRLGVRSLAEALRAVPGFEVAQLDSYTWAVSARGFNSQFSNKLLVLIDGRSVYNTFFSGVYWDMQDTFFPDIERIEAIRGPGGTVWGANAVNGVVNVITKSARDTLGGYAYGSVGTERIGAGGLRYGLELGKDAWARVYLKGYEWDATRTMDGDSAGDEWWTYQGGFRTDWETSSQDTLTFQGDAFNGDRGDETVVLDLDPPFLIPHEGSIHTAGWNLLGRWTRDLGQDSDLQLQAYYDHTERDERLVTIQRDALDLDFQHHFSPLAGHDVVWGLGYRLNITQIQGHGLLEYEPMTRNDQLFSGFLQDEITLVEDRLYAVLGTKLEHNDYTGFEYQPSARIRWHAAENQTVWGAVSRAVRNPSRAARDTNTLPLFVVPNPPNPPSLGALVGNPDQESEDLLAFEAGYRVTPVKDVELDLALYYNKYRHLVTFNPGTPFPRLQPQPHLVLPFFYDNDASGEAYGAELAFQWKVTDNWRLAGHYTFTELQIHASDASSDFSEAPEGETPHHQAHLRSYWDITDELELNGAVYYVDNVPAFSAPSYVRLDAQVAWQPADNLRFTAGVQNILDDQHPEGTLLFGFTSREIERRGYAAVTFTF